MAQVVFMCTQYSLYAHSPVYVHTVQFMCTQSGLCAHSPVYVHTIQFMCTQSGLCAHSTVYVHTVRFMCTPYSLYTQFSSFVTHHKTVSLSYTKQLTCSALMHTRTHTHTHTQFMPLLHSSHDARSHTHTVHNCGAVDYFQLPRNITTPAECLGHKMCLSQFLQLYFRIFR